MIDSVCKDCEERYPACHDHCEKYLTAKSKFEKNKAIVHKAKKTDRDFQRYYVELTRKLRGKK